MLKYADDISIVVPLPNDNSSDIRNIIDCETRNVKAWCLKNLLKLNSDKSNVMIVSRHSVSFEEPLPVNRVSVTKCLGLFINDKLTWETHINYLRVKCGQRLHIIRRLKSLVPVCKLHDIYSAIIRSVLDYASPVFIGLSKKENDVLKKIRNRAHRIMYNGTTKCHKCCDKLEDRRVVLSRRLFNEIERDCSHLLRDRLPPRFALSNRYMYPFVRTEKYGRSFFPFLLQHVGNYR